MEYQTFNTTGLPIQGIPPSSPAPVLPSKSKLPLIITTVLICVIGGGVFAYYKFSTPKISPAEIFKNSLQASLSVKSLSFMATTTGVVENNMGNGIPSASNFTLTSNGSIDFHSLDQPLLNLNFGAKASVNDATSTGSFLLGVDTIYLNKNLYLNLKEFNISFTSTDLKTAGAQMFIGLANGFASALKNKWIQIDTSKTIKASSTQVSLDQEDVSAIKDYVLGMSYIKAISNLREENIGGIQTNHIKVSIQNGQEFVDLVRKISLKKQSVAPMDMGEFNRRLDDLSKAIGQQIDLDLWIGKNDSFVYKMVTSPVAIDDTETGTKTKMGQEIVLGNYNKPLSLTAPQGAMSFEQVIEKLFGSMTGKSTNQTPSKTTPKIKK